ncbi:MAG: dTDP-4-dehydrorhamnose 3,5-epimerase [Candidatus Marinimicrobia bacterium]|nr:dTDP-4-dehydrorhamnose 3,5-epimerase [Candidatus Neomarinimicrobiota bacterium]
MPLIVESLSIPEVKVIRPAKHGDDRGFFSETFSRRDFATAGINGDFVQDNHAFSAQKCTMRGLHFQIPPFAQDKLVRVVHGSLLDVAVDIRTGSPNYGKHVSVQLSANAWNQVLVPAGFAHGLMTLEPNTEVLYKVTNYYSSEHDKGVIWNDPALGIDWFVAEASVLLSTRDKNHPLLKDLPEYFRYEREVSQ